MPEPPTPADEYPPKHKDIKVQNWKRGDNMPELEDSFAPTTPAMNDQQPQSVELEKILMEFGDEAVDSLFKDEKITVEAFRKATTAINKLIASVANEAELKGRIDELDKIKLDGNNLLRMKDWIITRRFRLNEELNQSEGSLMIKRLSIYFLIGGGGYIIGLAHDRWWGYLGAASAITGYLIMLKLC